LPSALYDNPPFFSNEFWIKNITLKELGIESLPENVQFEKKYKVKDLGINPFYASKPMFDFLDKVAETAWKEGTKLAIGTFLLK